MNIHRELLKLGAVCCNPSATVEDYNFACSNMFTELAKIPLTVCLCGPLTNVAEYREVSKWMELQGIIVHMPLIFRLNTDEYTDKQREDCHELHLRKLDCSQICFVIDKDDYVGATTRDEMDYALMTGIDVLSMNTDGYDKTYAYVVKQDDDTDLTLTINALQRHAAMDTAFIFPLVTGAEPSEVFTSWCGRVGLEVSDESYLLYDAFRTKELQVLNEPAMSRCKVLAAEEDRTTAVYAIKDFLNCSYGDASLWQRYIKQLLDK